MPLFKSKKKQFNEYAQRLDGKPLNLLDEVVLDVYLNQLDNKLNDKLPIELKKRNYWSIKKKPFIHCEGVYKDHWLQYVLTSKGLAILVDNFELDNVYMKEDYIPYSDFETKEELYAFIIEAFDFYFEKITKGSTL